MRSRINNDKFGDHWQKMSPKKLRWSIVSSIGSPPAIPIADAAFDFIKDTSYFDRAFIQYQWQNIARMMTPQLFVPHFWRYGG